MYILIALCIMHVRFEESFEAIQFYSAHSMLHAQISETDSPVIASIVMSSWHVEADGPCQTLHFGTYFTNSYSVISFSLKKRFHIALILIEKVWGLQSFAHPWEHSCHDVQKSIVFWQVGNYYGNMSFFNLWKFWMKTPECHGTLVSLMT